MNHEQQFIRIAHAIEYLYDHSDEQPSLETMASQVYLSPEHFLRQLQAWAGVSPKKFLQYISIERAKNTLKHQATMLDTAHADGLSSTGRLHDLFVNIESMTPGEYSIRAVQLDYLLIVNITRHLLAKCSSPVQDGEYALWSFADDKAAAFYELGREFPKATLSQQSSPYHAQALSILDTGSTQAINPHLKGTPFQLKVWSALLCIASGELRSYGDIAERIGHPKASRAVGTAVGKNPIALIIPCHRVIRESGVIGGYRWQRGRKMALLAQ